MKRAAAISEAEELNRTHPERERFHWFAREDASGTWSVARVSAVGRPPTAPGTTQQEKQPPPPDEHPLDLPGGIPPWGA